MRVRIRQAHTISERKFMFYSAASVWVATVSGIVVATIAAPEIGPSHLLAWQLGLVASGLIFLISHLTWMRMLDDVRAYQVEFCWYLAMCLVELTMMLLNPLAIGALSIALLGPVISAANFYRAKATIFMAAFASACAIAPVLAAIDEVQQQHMISRITAFVPIMWAVAFAVYALNRDRKDAVVAGRRSAMTDPLTGVANLRALETRAKSVLNKRNARIAGSTGLLLIDLDDFKRANTLHGHGGGDHVLRMVGTALKRAASSTHMVARIGGDEFAVLIENADGRDLGDLAIRYRNAIVSARADVELPGVTIDASIGTALADRPGMTLEDLLTTADRAMYEVKDRHTAEAEANRAAELKTLLPNEFQTPRFAGFASEVHPDEDGAPVNRFAWSQRPIFARFAALTWALGVTVGLISLMMPDADHTYFAQAVIALLCGYVVSVIAYFTAPEAGSWRHLANDVFTLCSIAFISFLTGGSESPMWPLVYLLIIYSAWFLDARSIWYRLLGPIMVIMLPLVYESSGEISAATGSALFSGVLVAFALTVAMSYNQFVLERVRRRTERYAALDPRTQLANRREFELRLQKELDGLKYHARESLSLVMIDLDNFKNVNTVHGHGAGDALLEQIAGALASCARTDDCVARIGGDEFAIVLPQVDAEIARALARRYVNAVAECTARSPLAACREVTASAGFAVYGIHGRTLDELINAADVALMSVKTTGKGVERVSSYVVSL